ncbi:hypothetical protein MAR_020548 [Mya arenaria]|uniref:Uncharacterized protein n=1 Tax=Mya arenaria TaxID=6604 RepID=A0ABY7E9U8_MYAAR|nr:hypothetical protein MAR_020548 [Mya arenaria]
MYIKAPTHVDVPAFCSVEDLRKHIIEEVQPGMIGILEKVNNDSNKKRGTSGPVANDVSSGDPTLVH